MCVRRQGAMRFVEVNIDNIYDHLHAAAVVRCGLVQRTLTITSLQAKCTRHLSPAQDPKQFDGMLVMMAPKPSCSMTSRSQECTITGPRCQCFLLTLAAPAPKPFAELRLLSALLLAIFLGSDLRGSLVASAAATRASRNTIF